MINFVSSSRPLKPAIPCKESRKVTMDSCAAEIHRYLDHNGLWNRIVIGKLCVWWLIRIRYQNILALSKCISLCSRRTYAHGWPLMSSLSSLIAWIVQKRGWFAKASQPFKILKLFPSFETLKPVATGILRPISQSEGSSQYIIVTTDWLLQLV